MTTPRRSTIALLVSALLLAVLAGYAVCRWLSPYRVQPQPWDMTAAWIGVPDGSGYTGYYRKTIDLPAAVNTAWLAVAAQDTFELVVNGQVIGTQSSWRPNRAFQFTVSERGQRVNNAKPVAGVAYARDYQWSNFENYRLPIFFDLARVLRPGRNVICIKVDSRTAPQSLCVRGEAILHSAQTIPLDSDASWKSAALPRRDAEIDWTDPNYNDANWTNALSVSKPGETYRSFDPAIFAKPFAAHWLRSSTDVTHRPVWFENTWHLDKSPDEAWVRLMTNRGYDLYVNGHKAQAASRGSSELAASDWIVHTSFASGAQSRLDALDPEDAGSLFGASEASSDDESADQTVTPTALLRDAQLGSFDAYSIGAMLKAGDNHIAVRLVSRDETLKWSPQLAIDGRALHGAEETDFAPRAADWTARFVSGAGDEATTVTEAGPAVITGVTAPRKRYLGFCYSAADKFGTWLLLGGATASVILGFAALLLVRRPDPRLIAQTTAGMAMAAVALACAVVLDCSFAVRDEVIWMLPGRTWAGILFLSLLAGVATTLLARRSFRFDFAAVGKWNGFYLTLAALVFLCGAVRLYRLEFQPTDADEWASAQTVLAVADTGTPKLTDDVYYTRSPLYHYTTAVSVLIFGKNFWALRLPTVFFAMATCLLIYRCGQRLLKSRWVGLGAVLLFALHPLAIDMGHQIRFYQQQQFFALLTIYWFCLGFVSEQGMRARYLTLAAFFAAVFSQEISVMIAFTLLASYLLFAQGKPWRDEAKWLTVAGCGMVFVVLDFVIFQTVCLTKLEGVSPRVEPALGLNLMFPGTLYWIFSLFSRLHFGLSAVFFLGIPFALRGRNRNVAALYLTFFLGVVFTTILITGSGVRFQYWLFPIFFLLTVHGAREFVRFALAPVARELPARQLLRGAMTAAFVLMIVASWSPWKIPASYGTKILPDVDGALAYVRENISSRDALAITAPHTAAALCEVGRVDYDIEIPLLHDFVYKKDGHLIDRNAGAEVIARLDDLQDACAKHNRVWVVLNRDIRFRSPGEKIAWQDPGGRFDLFVRTNLELKHQTYLTDVFLWDASKGRLRPFQRNL